MLFDTNQFLGFGVAGSCPSCGDFGPRLHCCLHLPSLLLPRRSRLAARYRWIPLPVLTRTRAPCDATRLSGWPGSEFHGIAVG
jgi:hypothetical protein